MILSADELIELTGRQRQGAQRSVLEALGVPYRVRPDGSLVVLREVVRAMLGGNTAPAAQRDRRPQLRLPIPAR